MRFGGNMKRILYILLAIVVLFFGLSFAVKNAQIVDLTYYFGLHWASPLSLMLLTIFSLGAGFGFLASLSMVIRMQHQLAQARREMRKIEQELINLRSLPIKDVL
jgi:lipopolysaccharide assembly protein A